LKKNYLLACCFLAGGIAAQGSVLLTNGSLDSSNGDLMTGYIEANSFSLSSSAVISGVNFDALVLVPQTFQSSVTWFIYADNSGSPGTQLATGNAAASTTDLGAALYSDYEVFGVDFSLNTPFSASAGTTYWLGLYDGALTNNSGNVYWSLSSGGQGAAMYLVSPYTGSWASTGQAPFYFQLTSAASSSAPEPASTALVSAGIAMLALRFGRRQH
jgi:hypothetical protein